MKFAFPYGVVKIVTKLPGRKEGQKTEWLMWRLPNGKAAAVEEAHRRMVAFCNADPSALRCQAPTAHADQRALVHAPSQ